MTTKKPRRQVDIESKQNKKVNEAVPNQPKSSCSDIEGWIRVIGKIGDEQRRALKKGRRKDQPRPRS